MQAQDIAPSSEPTKILLTSSGEHHEIGDGGWLMMMKTGHPPLRSPERTPYLVSR